VAVSSAVNHTTLHSPLMLAVTVSHSMTAVDNGLVFSLQFSGSFIIHL